VEAVANSNAVDAVFGLRVSSNKLSDNPAADDEPLDESAEVISSAASCSGSSYCEDITNPSNTLSGPPSQLTST
jgi:hypothetical protein